MDKNRTDQKRDEETGHWISDLKPGASQEAKVDKGVEDTFPASDPFQKAGATGFIAPDGTDTAVHDNLPEQTPAGMTDALGQASQAGGAAIATVDRNPLPALLIAGTIGFVFGLLVNGRR